MTTGSSFRLHRGGENGLRPLGVHVAHLLGGSHVERVDRRGMEDRVAALEAGFDRVGLGHVADHMVDFADAERRQRGPDPLRLPYQQTDLVTPPDELGNGMRADEPRRPRDEDANWSPSAYSDSAWTETGLLVATMTQ